MGLKLITQMYKLVVILANPLDIEKQLKNALQNMSSNKKWFCLGLTTLMCLLVIGCGDINEGQVTEKKHHEAWTRVGAVTSGMSPHGVVVKNPERWVLMISDAGKSASCNVPKEIWHNTQVGDWVKCN